MDFIVTIVVLLVSAISIIYGFFKYWFGYWKSRGVPFDEPSIPYGNVKGVGTKYHLSDVMTKLYIKHKPTGAPICGVYFFARPVAILLDLDQVKNVYIKDFSNFDEINVYLNAVDDPLTDNMFALDAESWKQLRSKLSPAFSSGKMKFMFPTIVEVTERFCNRISEVATKSELEMSDWCARYTIDVIGTCVFGIECNSLKDPDAQFVKYSKRIVGGRHGPLFMSLLNGFKNLGRFFHVKVLYDDLAEFIMDTVRNTVDYRKENNVRRNDLLDSLIKLHQSDSKENSLTFNEIAAQCFLFFAAGFESSATTLGFCLYELSVNPSIQDKARHVIQETYKKYNGQFTYEMMTDVPYITQILEETMRKYAPVATQTREAKNDYRFPGTDIVIEKGTTVVIPVRGIQSDPDYYPNPEKFDPDRFGAEESQKRHPMAWLPFGSGPRNCIGIRFGMMQMQIALVHLLTKFEFSLGDKTPVPLITRKIGGIFSPQDGIHLKVKVI